MVMDVSLVPGSSALVLLVAVIVWETAPCATRSTHAAVQRRMGRDCLAMGAVSQEDFGGVRVYEDTGWSEVGLEAAVQVV